MTPVPVPGGEDDSLRHSPSKSYKQVTRDKRFCPSHTVPAPWER